MASWFGGSSSVGHSKHHSSSSHRHSSHRRSPSPDEKRKKDAQHYFVHHRNSSSPARSVASTVSRSIFGSFSGNKHHSSTSRYKRSSRDGYISRIIHTIKKLIRDLYGYARRHPVKIFMLVILPLITGGALQGALRKMGVQMPAALAGLGGLGGAAKGFGGDGYSGRSESSGGGGIDLGQVVNIAKMFM